MKLNPFNKDFGNRLWGASLTIWLVSLGWNEYPAWAKLIAIIVALYFLYCGSTRFDKEYRKII